MIFAIRILFIAIAIVLGMADLYLSGLIFALGSIALAVLDRDSEL